MINREATIRWKGYDPIDLKPCSHKRVWVNCIDCGSGRWVEFCNKSDRCRSCGQILADPSSMALKYYTDHPEACKDMSKIMKQYYIDNPDAVIGMSERAIQYNKAHPEKSYAHSIKMAKYWAEQANCDEMSIIKKEHYKKHPEHLEQISARMQGIPYEEWEGFIGENEWRDWDNAIYVNESFPGCHRHHITETIVAHIPAELHNHVRHNLKTGANMGEINALSIQFINGGL